MSGEKIRQSLLTFPLSSADPPSILRVFFIKKLVLIFTVNFPSKTCWDFMYQCIEALGEDNPKRSE